MILVDEAAALERLSLQDAAIGPPSSFTENVVPAFRATRASELTVSGELALSDEYDKLIEDIERQTGKRLLNPVTEENREGQPPRAFASSDASRMRDFAEGITDEFTPSIELREEEFSKRAQELGVEIDTMDVRRRAVQGILDSVRENQQVSERATTLGAVGQFIGSAGAIVTDPPVLASTIFGASAASGVLRTMLIEAGIGAGVETAIQPKIQRFRKQIGLPSGPGQAAINILAAGVGGAALGGLIKGGVVGARTLLERARALPEKTQTQRAAESVLERQVEALEDSPFPVTQRSDQTHVERHSAQETALRTESRLTDLDDPPPVRPEIKRPRVTVESVPEETSAAFRGGQALRQALLESDEEVARGVAAEARQILEVAEAILPALRRPPAPPRVKSLVQFLKEQGGIRDEGGEVTQGLGISARDRPGFINNRTGLALDEAAERASEAGYFGGRGGGTDFDTGDRASSAELLQAVDSEFRGTKRFRTEDLQELEDFDAINRNVESVNDFLATAGIDLKRLSDSEVIEQLRGLAGPARRPAVDGNARAQAEARQAAGQAEQLETETDSLQDIAEADIRSVLNEEDFDVLIGEGDTPERVSARELLEDLDDDAQLQKEWDDCLKNFNPTDDVPF